MELRGTSGILEDWRPVLLALLALLQAPDSWLTSFQAATDEAAFLRCLELSPENATTAYHLAALHAREDRRDAALEWIERAVEWGYADDAVLAWDEDFRGLRGDSRFTAAIARAAEQPLEPLDVELRWQVPGRSEVLMTPDGPRSAVVRRESTLLWDPVEQGVVAMLDTPREPPRAPVDRSAQVLVTLEAGEERLRPRMQARDLVTGDVLWDVALPRAWVVPLGPGVRFALEGTNGPRNVGSAGPGSTYRVSLADGSISEIEAGLSDVEWIGGKAGNRRTFELGGSAALWASSPLALDSSRIVLAVGDELRIVEVDTGRLRSKQALGLGRIDSLEKCGSFLSALGRGGALLIDPLDSSRNWSLLADRVWPSADGTLLLAAHRGTARVFDVTTRAVLRELPVGGWVSTAAWSDDGARVAIAVDRNVRVWNLATGEPARHELEHQGSVHSLDFRDDGRQLVTGCFDAGPGSQVPLLRVWDVAGGATIATAARLGHLEHADDVQILEHLQDDAVLLTVLGGIPDIEARDARSLERLWGHYGYDSGPNWLDLTLTASGRLFAGSSFGEARVLDSRDGSLIRAFDASVTDLVPSPDEQRAFAIREGALQVLEGTSLELLYTRIEYPGVAGLVVLPSLHFTGTPGTWERTWILEDGCANPLLRWAESLYDPKRVAAAAAGVRVRPARRR